VAACAAQASPNQRVGRPMKVGKEELAGLLAAVELYLAQDHAARRERCESIVSGWVEEASGWPGVSARRTFPNEAGQPLPRALISFDPAVCGVTGADVRRGLWEGDPRVAVAAAGETGISMTPDTLEPGEEALVSAALAGLLARARPVR
jgi:L-seryl-tRNA(Ser) seleniumtransferase